MKTIEGVCFSENFIWAISIAEIEISNVDLGGVFKKIIFKFVYSYSDANIYLDDWLYISSYQ